MTDEFPPNRPTQKVLDMACAIRLAFGFGGATFPGARELYDAADKIEAWATAKLGEDE